MIWAALAAMAGMVGIALAVPLLRRERRVDGRHAYDLAIYKDQLAEVERDLDRGLLTAAEADGVRCEIQRRILAAGTAEERRATPHRGLRLAVPAVVAVLVPAAAVTTYLHLGRPDLPDVPYSAQAAMRLDSSHGEAADMLNRVKALAERLQAAPDNVDGWIMLGKSYKALGQPGKAVEALRTAVGLGTDDPEVFAILGESLVAGANGTITPAAYQAFTNALTHDPDQVRARFYLGLAEAQAGRPRAAIAIWRDLEQASPADAQWLPVLRQQMANLAEATAIDIASVPPAPPQMAEGLAPPNSGNREAAPAGRGDMETVLAIVSRLEQRLQGSPDDAAGWFRLARSYRVLGRLDDADGAYRQGLSLQPDNVDARMDYAELLISQAPDDRRLPRSFVTQMRAILKVAPDHGDARYYVGLAELQGGNPTGAREHWEHLLGLLSPGSEEHAMLRDQIRELPGG